jgi:sulfhydrogenase subunit beta (sulfur reductase)
MPEVRLEMGTTVALPKTALPGLLANLEKMGYDVIGPQVKDNTIVYASLSQVDDLPRGYTSDQFPGSYRLKYTGHENYFDITPGPQSWKMFLFPPRSQMVALHKSENTAQWEVTNSSQSNPPYAFFGVRPCELAAIQVQDRVFLREDYKDPFYRKQRQSALIISVNCLHPCGTCFCASMNTGPEATSGFDLNLTELEDDFIVQTGSEAGRMVVESLPWKPASAFLIQSAKNAMDDARNHMGRSLPHPEELPGILLNNLNHPQFDDVAKRCLSCTNCTQVCPTCFCWDVQDLNDLSGNNVRRERVWDSCFNPEYSYVFGGNSRPNTRSRYRQWITHKLAGWYQQFGTSGCVGCGRCITWCPAGIDITAEAAALREEAI